MNRLHLRCSWSRALPVAALFGGLCLPAAARAQTFGLFANAYLDSTRVPMTRITVEVPFRTLVFLKKEGYYDSRYEAYISIRPAGNEKARPTTYVLNGFATVQTYDETRRRDQKSRAYREIKLAPGEYTIDGQLTIRNTEISLHRSDHACACRTSSPRASASARRGSMAVPQTTSGRSRAGAKWRAAGPRCRQSARMRRSPGSSASPRFVFPSISIKPHRARSRATSITRCRIGPTPAPVRQTPRDARRKDRRFPDLVQRRRLGAGSLPRQFARARVQPGPRRHHVDGRARGRDARHAGRQFRRPRWRSFP